MAGLLKRGDDDSSIFPFLHKFRFIFRTFLSYFASTMHPCGSNSLRSWHPFAEAELGAGFPSCGYRGLLGYECG